MHKLDLGAEIRRNAIIPADGAEVGNRSTPIAKVTLVIVVIVVAVRKVPGVSISVRKETRLDLLIEATGQSGGNGERADLVKSIPDIH
jgi:hypothetical protein